MRLAIFFQSQKFFANSTHHQEKIFHIFFFNFKKPFSRKFWKAPKERNYLLKKNIEFNLFSLKIQKMMMRD